MNEEIDDLELYHQDFTTASDWERFTAQIEEAVSCWKAEKASESTTNEWEIKVEKLNFADANFELLYYSRKKSTTEPSTDEEPKHPIDSWRDFELYDERNNEKDFCLSTWYGLDEFIVLSPKNFDDVMDESKIKTVLSSLYITSGNLKCRVPMFLQIREKWQRLYIGVYEEESVRTHFEMVHLHKGPPYCYYLTGLLDMFKSKIMSPCSLEDVIVSFQSKYILKDFGKLIWNQELNFEHTENLFSLPFGVSIEPIASLTFKATWHYLSEQSVVDSENHSDFDPMIAPDWSCISTPAAFPLCHLGECLTEFFSILNTEATLYNVIEDFIVVPAANNPLAVLTEPTVPSILPLLSRAARKSMSRGKKSDPPVADYLLEPILYFLFPDADENANHPYNTIKEDDNRKRLFNRHELFRGFKTCPEDSLVWRLGIILTHAFQSLGGLRALSHIWYEFAQEMRFRWDNGFQIPGVEEGFPDLRTCLLNQKLQMLNCCIKRKANRHIPQSNRSESAQDSDESEDEFFDCSDDDSRNKEKYSLWNQPVGRQSKFGEMKLLETGDPLYIPITQEPVLKTEDQLEEDTAILLKMGSDQEASELRARVMSPSLLSDMESFKAANPGSILEDFIRWYSPRDWIEDDDLDEYGQKRGHLSPRMQMKDNIWVEMWENAKPVPANRQKRLFDDTREAEKVLQFLDVQTSSQIAQLFMPILLQIALYRLIDELEELPVKLPEMEERIKTLLKRGEKISRDNTISIQNYEIFVQELVSLELRICQANSLLYKLNPSSIDNRELFEAVGVLVTGKEVIIKDKESLLGKGLVSLFESQRRRNSEDSVASGERSKNSAKNKIFPSPDEREFVFRIHAKKPAIYSQKCPQFLRAVLNKDEFRLAGAFSEDIAFF